MYKFNASFRKSAAAVATELGLEFISSKRQVENGTLTITARKESYGGKDYTSARLTTQNKFDFKYGRKGFTNR